MVREQIITKLEAAFNPVKLEVIDESHQHEGHSGWREGGETHFRIRMVAIDFKSKSRIDAHRTVNAVLTDELAGPVHALALEISAPE